MVSFCRDLYDVLLGPILATLFPLATYLGMAVFNVLMRVALAFAFALLYTAIITLLLYLCDRSEHENQG